MDKTLLKGLMVLEVIASAEQESLTIGELAKLTGLTRSNVHRILQTLAHAGYLNQDPDTGTYAGNTRMFELGQRQLSKLDVQRIAPRYLRELVEKTGETAHLSVLRGTDVVYIDELPGPHPVRTHTVVGSRAPAYAVATGKALLSRHPDDYLPRHQVVMQAHTRATLRTASALAKELETVRRLGYAVNRGEWRESVGGVAAVILNRDGSPVASIGIAAPIGRLGRGPTSLAAKTIMEVAAAISARLGYNVDQASD